MSEFSHIEITIENVATDGTRTRTTRWTCPSVEMGSAVDGRVQLRFAGEPVVVTGEPATRCPVGGLRYVEGSEPVKPLYDAIPWDPLTPRAWGTSPTTLRFGLSPVICAPASTEMCSGAARLCDTPACRAGADEQSPGGG